MSEASETRAVLNLLAFLIAIFLFGCIVGMAIERSRTTVHPIYNVTVVTQP